MSAIGDRIKELRKEQGLTQTALAEKVGLTYVQIGRYEKRGATPSAEVLGKLADALDTTSDYLMNGNTDNFSAQQLQDKKLIGLFKKVEGLNKEDKDMVISFVDAFVLKAKLQQQLAS